MASLSGRRILVVEEDAPSALILENMLRTLGCSVPGRTSTASDAVAIIETDRLGLDAATLKLSGEGWTDVAAALELHGIPFVIIAGPNAPDIAAPYKNRPVLLKPFLIDDLRSSLGALDMRRRHSTR